MRILCVDFDRKMPHVKFCEFFQRSEEHDQSILTLDSPVNGQKVYQNVINVQLFLSWSPGNRNSCGVVKRRTCDHSIENGNFASFCPKVA